MKEKRHPSGVQLLIRTVVRDPDGKVLHDSGQKPSHSFVIQFLEFIRALFDGLSASATAVDGTEDSIYSSAANCINHLQILAGVNDGARGIVIGTGETAADNEDHKLETQLTEGTGAGNITHGAVTLGTAAVVGANVDLEAVRSFTNNTGSTITVKEAGIYTRTTFSIDYHCLIRDVLASSIAVPDKCSLTVYYTARTTV